MTNLTGFLHGAARNLSGVLDEEIVQYVHLPAFLSAYWTSNCTYLNKRADTLLNASTHKDLVNRVQSAALKKTGNKKNNKQIMRTLVRTDLFHNSSSCSCFVSILVFSG